MIQHCSGRTSCTCDGTRDNRGQDVCGARTCTTYPNDTCVAQRSGRTRGFDFRIGETGGLSGCWQTTRPEVPDQRRQAFLLVLVLCMLVDFLGDTLNSHFDQDGGARRNGNEQP